MKSIWGKDANRGKDLMRKINILLNSLFESGSFPLPYIEGYYLY